MSNHMGYEASDLQPGCVTVNEQLTALAVFSCLPNSHPFNERRVAVSEPVKIGRSVPRARPSPNNVIFDCKVLSRNHALLHYTNGMFLLEDTLSSNGTFVNNQRLGKASDEKSQQEIFSGDHVQFGVDVTENSRRVTHGCIIATIQLFHPDGREVRPSYNNMMMSSPAGSSVKCQELYELAQYLKEALHRERMLESKLTMLQRLVQNTQQASDSGWQALIDEDRLLSRLEVLENQLQAYSTSQTEDLLRKELVSLHEDKHTYETSTKESLRKVLEEKLNAVQKLAELEHTLKTTEEECTHLKDMCESSQTELQSLAEKHEDQVKEFRETQEKLLESEREHSKELEQIEQEKTELQRRINDMQENETLLAAKVESLTADNDFRNEQHTNMKSQLDSLKEKSFCLTKDINECKCNTQGTQVNMQLDNKLELFPIIDNNEDISENELKELLRDTKQTVDYYKYQLDDTETRLENKQQEVHTLQGQLETARSEILQNAKEISALEEKVRVSKENIGNEMDNTVTELQSQLNEAKKQAENSNCIVQTLKDEIEELKLQLSNVPSSAEMPPTTVQEAILHSLESDANLLANNTNNAVIRPTIVDGLSCSDNQIVTDVDNNSDDNNVNDNDIGYSTLRPSRQSLDTSVVDSTLSDMSINETICEDDDRHAVEKQLQDEINSLKGRLENAEQSAKEHKEEVKKLQDELDDVRSQHKVTTDEVELLNQQLGDMQQKAKDRTDTVNTLQDQLQRAEISTQDVKNQILTLRDRLVEEQEASKDRMVENSLLRQQLQEAEQCAKQNKNEAEQFKTRLEVLQTELVGQQQRCEELLQKSATTTTHTVASTHQEIQVQAAKNKENLTDEDKDKENLSSYSSVEFSGLKEECANFRIRIQDIETEMKQSRRENMKLKTDYERLKQSYLELEALKDKLENQEVTWKINLTDAQKDANNTKEELTEANGEISVLKNRCSQLNEEIGQLKRDLDSNSEEFDLLAFRSKTLSHVSMLPLILLLLAFVMAMYPTLSSITATNTPDT